MANTYRHNPSDPARHFRGSSSGLRLSFPHESGIRTLTIAPWAAIVITLIVAAVLAWCFAVTGYVMFRDQVIRSMVHRHAQTVESYEGQLSSLRLQVDALRGRQFVNQDSLEAGLKNLSERQERIETRQEKIREIMERANGASLDASDHMPEQHGTAAWDLDTQTASALPPRSKPGRLLIRPSFASHGGQTVSRPAAVAQADFSFLADTDPGPHVTSARALASRLSSIERSQTTTLNALETAALQEIARLESVFADIRLPSSRFVENAPENLSTGTGGPFLPVPEASASGDAFIRQLARIDTVLATVETFQNAVDVIPIRRPVAGNARISSGFGVRVDPFLGRRAMHSGIDFAVPTGTRIIAPASGTVAKAKWWGGYGNAVEIDHGNGVVSRYGHLSKILVKEGQAVSTGEVIGKAGSTGRSTGPHLHYETWVDEKAVNPMRFLGAGT